MRYANLIANGTKDWPYSGGEPTNKYLRKFEFEIIPKGEEPEMPPCYQRRLYSITPANGTWWLQHSFCGAADLMDSFECGIR